MSSGCLYVFKMLVTVQLHFHHFANLCTSCPRCVVEVTVMMAGPVGGPHDVVAV